MEILALSAIDSEIIHGSRLAGATLTSHLHQGSVKNLQAASPLDLALGELKRIFVPEPLVGTVTYTTTSQVLSTTWPTPSPRTQSKRVEKVPLVQHFRR